jgi:malate dehydrogenase (oxaloacetate-decarboxylating)(NADP+)
MLSSQIISKSLTNLVKQGRNLGRRNYGLPASAIGLGTDPRKDKTVQLTPLRGVNIIHDPLLSKGKKTNNEKKNIALHKHLRYCI